MDILKRILAVLGTIIAGLFIFRKRPQVDNTQVDKNVELAKNEELKREEIVKQGEAEKDKDVNQKDIIDFFSNRPK